MEKATLRSSQDFLCRALPGISSSRSKFDTSTYGSAKGWFKVCSLPMEMINNDSINDLYVEAFPIIDTFGWVFNHAYAGLSEGDARREDGARSREPAEISP